MTDADLLVWLEKVRKLAAEEGGRWRGLQRPGDLAPNAWTTDRVHLTVVGNALAKIEILASLAHGSLSKLKPKPTGIPPGGVRPKCVGFLTVGCGHEFTTPGEPAKCRGDDLCSACKVRKEERATGPKCCDHAGEFDGGGDCPPAPWRCTEPNGCACHD